MCKCCHCKINEEKAEERLEVEARIQFINIGLATLVDSRMSLKDKYLKEAEKEAMSKLDNDPEYSALEKQINKHRKTLEEMRQKLFTLK